MITKDMVESGIDKGIICFGVDPNAMSGTVCRIGNHWFYFGGSEAERYNPKEYLKNTPKSDVAREILETLNEFGTTEVFKDEYAYYESVLTESLEAVAEKPASLTKQELMNELARGKTMLELFDFVPGQECEIYKAGEFVTDRTIIYIPDLTLNKIPVDRPVCDRDELDYVLAHCYTGADFLEECGGNRLLAERLFHYCDWQNPSSALPEIQDDEMDKSHAMTIVEYCPECENEIEMKWDINRLGYKAFCPICGNRLMLCDACQHDENDEYLGDCDYCSDIDQCKHNKGRDSDV